MLSCSGSSGSAEAGPVVDTVADAVAGAPINTSSALIISRARPADAPRPGARNSPAGLITAPTLSVRQASASIRTQPLVAPTLAPPVPFKTPPAIGRASWRAHVV